MKAKKSYIIYSNIKSSKISCRFFWKALKKKQFFPYTNNFAQVLFHLYKDQAFDKLAEKERWEEDTSPSITESCSNRHSCKRLCEMLYITYVK